MDFIYSCTFADVLPRVVEHIDIAGCLSLLHVSKYMNKQITAIAGEHLMHTDMSDECPRHIGLGNIKFARWLHEYCGLQIGTYLVKYPCDNRWNELKEWLNTIDDSIQIYYKPAISSNNLEAFQYCIEVDDGGYNGGWWHSIMKHPNRLPMLKMMVDGGKTFTSFVWQNLITSGIPDTDLSVSNWLIDAGCKPHASDIISAGKYGLFHLVKLMINILANKPITDPLSRTDMSDDMFDDLVRFAVYYRNITILRLVSTDFRGDMSRVEILTTLIKSGHRLSSSYLVMFIEYYDKDVVEYLLECGCPIDDSGIEYAAVQTENVQLLRKLKQFGVPKSGSSVKCAARTGNFELLDCIMQYSTPSFDDSHDVIMAGNLEMLQQFISAGYYIHDDIVYHEKIYYVEVNYELFAWLLVEYPPADPLCRFIRYNFRYHQGMYASCVKLPDDIEALSKWCRDVAGDGDVDNLFEFLDATAHVSGPVAYTCNKHTFDAGKWSPAIVAKLIECVICTESTLMVKKLFDATYCNTTIHDIAIALRRNNLKMVKFLVSRYLREGGSFATGDKTGWLMIEAFNTQCSVKMLEFLLESGVQVVPELYNIAFHMDSSNHIRWLHTVGCQLPHYMILEVSDNDLIIRKYSIYRGMYYHLESEKTIPLTA